MGYIEHKANSFCKQYKLNGGEITFSTLRKAAKQCGYIVMSYSNGAELMILYDIFDDAQKSASICIKDADDNVIIFIDDTMPIDKQTYGLAHEIGHVVLGHELSSSKKSKQEYDANLFAHYLLSPAHPDIIEKLCFGILVAICALSFVLTIALIILASSHDNTPDVISEITILNTSVTVPEAVPETVSEIQDYENQTETDIDVSSIYYWTDSGHVYHSRRDCQSLKNSTEIHSGTLSEAQGTKDRLCKFCERNN